MTTQEFPFRFDRQYRPLLLLYGVTPGRSGLVVGELDVTIDFGPWRIRTPRDNIVSAKETGPYRWWRGIGIRLSLVDRGITFGSTTSGVCLEVREPVLVETRRGRKLPGKHPGVTVTVEDTAGLVRLLGGGDVAGR